MDEIAVSLSHGPHSTVGPPAGESRDGRWFRRGGVGSAGVRLFCFPYAGGSAGLYRNWYDWLAPEVEVVAVELPGRGIHMRGALVERMEDLVRRLVEAMRPLLDRPFALFGHSLGGLVAFELSCALTEMQVAPVHLFVSAIAAPHLFTSGPNLHDLPEAEFMQALRRLNGAAARTLENDDLRGVLLPMLRADFRLAETYRYVARQALLHPITVFGGLDDSYNPYAALEAWQRHTQDSCAVRLLDGDHFFIHQYEHLMAASIAHCLRGASATAGGQRVR
jgi:medium-chain acyl-[acyl-carrier-protein] hydrolase